MVSSLIKLKKRREEQIRPRDDGDRQSSASSNSTSRVFEEVKNHDKALSEAIAQDEEWGSDELIVKSKVKPKFMPDDDDDLIKDKKHKVVVIGAPAPEKIEMIKPQLINVKKMEVEKQVEIEVKKIDPLPIKIEVVKVQEEKVK